MKKISIESYSLWESLKKTAYSVKEKDLEKAAKVMAAAFDSDPSVRYLLGGECESRDDWRYFIVVLRVVFGKCVLLSLDECVENLLILFPPELKAVPFFRFCINICRLFGIKLLLRSMNYENNCGRIKKRCSPPDAWYRMCFVVHPQKQGRGIGTQLIKPVLRVLENQHISAYLETNKKNNTHIYEHFGFGVVDVSQIPGTNITQYAMIKKALNKFSN